MGAHSRPPDRRPPSKKYIDSSGVIRYSSRSDIHAVSGDTPWASRAIARRIRLEWRKAATSRSGCRWSFKRCNSSWMSFRQTVFAWRPVSVPPASAFYKARGVPSVTNSTKPLSNGLFQPHEPSSSGKIYEILSRYIIFSLRRGNSSLCSSKITRLGPPDQGGKPNGKGPYLVPPRQEYQQV